MTALTWDEVGERKYETGVDHGVLYIPNGSGEYDDGVAWNGLTTVTESPSGAEANPQYADNIQYLNLFSAEKFGGTLEAFTYPQEFEQFDGLVSTVPGITVGQQARKPFGLCYRTKLGNDLDGEDHGFKLHLVYGCTAAPSEKAYNTINDSPEAMTLSWTISTSPVNVAGLRPTSVLTIDSTTVDETDLAALMLVLYGTDGVDPALPMPDDVHAFFGAQTTVTALTPSFTPATGAIVIPTVTGVQYRRADTDAVVTGTVTIGVAGGHLTITANPLNNTYKFSSFSDDDWAFTRDP